MTPRTFIALLIPILLAGCATAPPPKEDVPQAIIDEAVFKVGSLDTCYISGAYFKLKSNNKMDVIASLNGRNWAPALKIVDSSPTSFVAILPYGPDHPQVFVRVYGMNGEYSPPTMVFVAKRAVKQKFGK